MDEKLIQFSCCNYQLVIFEHFLRDSAVRKINKNSGVE